MSIDPNVTEGLTLQNVVLLVSDKECYLVEAPDATWDALVRNHNELHAAAVSTVWYQTKQTQLKRKLTLRKTCRKT